MDGALKILLLAALTLLVPAQEFGNYRSLPDDLRKHIDKALEKAHQVIAKERHVAFFSIQGKPKLQRDLYVNVLLKITTCEKSSNSAYVHRDECSKQITKRLIDCLVCMQNDGQELVDCAWRNEVKNKWPEKRNNCGKYRHGTYTAFQKSDDNEEIGCVGCL